MESPQDEGHWAWLYRIWQEYSTDLDDNEDTAQIILLAKIIDRLMTSAKLRREARELHYATNSFCITQPSSGGRHFCYTPEFKSPALDMPTKVCDLLKDTGGSFVQSAAAPASIDTCVRRRPFSEVLFSTPEGQRHWPHTVTLNAFYTIILFLYNLATPTSQITSHSAHADHTLVSGRALFVALLIFLVMRAADYFHNPENVALEEIREDGDEEQGQPGRERMIGWNEG